MEEPPNVLSAQWSMIYDMLSETARWERVKDVALWAALMISEHEDVETKRPLIKWGKVSEDSQQKGWVFELRDV